MKIEIPHFEKARVLVVGDVMLDRYWQGDVSRISPEAPVPVVHVKHTQEKIGGAGNVALNVSSLGGKAKLLGLVGDDEFADIIEKRLEQNGIECSLLRVAGVPTISKLRVMGHSQQLMRLDFEQCFEKWNEDEFFATYQEQLSDSDLVILSDYGKGTLRHSTKLIDLARKMGKPVLVDPKNKNLEVYRGATLVTPNFSEFEAMVGSCSDESEIEDKAVKLLEQYDFQAILVTRGALGMSLICKGKPALHLPTEAQEVFDVTGAGDTVIAALGTAMAIGMDLSDAALISNAAAGEAVRRLGTNAISISELRSALRRRLGVFEAAILDEESLVQYVKDAKKHGEKIVMTNGCFDILHSGHVSYLEKTKALGHKLIVAVNDDDSVSKLKGPQRPINSLRERMEVLAALGAVDWVVPFSEDTPERLIKLVSPDVLTKAGDYQVHEIAGSDHVLISGGAVEIIPFEDGCSTSSVIKKIKTEAK